MTRVASMFLVMISKREGGGILIGVSDAVIKHHDQKQLGGKGFISFYSFCHHPGKSEATEELPSLFPWLTRPLFFSLFFL